MTRNGSSPSRSLAGRLALRIVVVYLVMGILWIALSDRALAMLVDDPVLLTWLQTFKGWAYVLVTALLLYGLIAWQMHVLAQANVRLEERGLHIARLNRVHAMLSAINGAILRIRHRDSLLRESCRIAVDTGGFDLAWVGLVNADARTLSPVASAGDALDCLDGLSLCIASGDPDAHPMAADLCARLPFVVNELSAIPPMDECHSRAVARGFRAMAVVPFFNGSQLLGVLGFLSRQATVFDADELQLLTEVAADTGLGLMIIDQAQALERSTRYDPLTGLPNRGLLEERIGQALLRARHHRRYIGVMALEVLGLRAVIDSLGRQQGDRLQQVVARRLLSRLREGDTVAHLGNGEFALLLCDLRMGMDVSEVADKLLEPFELEMGGDLPPLHVKLSAGAAVYPGDAESGPELLHCAGVALHQGGAQSHAGRCVFYAREMDERVREYQALDNELQGALQRDEMHLHYQPIVNTRDGSVLGVEALLRWDNRRFGSVSPGRFIPMAEHSGLILSLGEWVLEQACAQIAHWRAQGWNHLHMSVNLSARQLLTPGFDTQVVKVLERHGLDKDDMPLVLEVTETAVIEDMEQVSEALFRLKRLGIAVHLDDFGTGYASLSYLHRLPVDALKIDQSFVRGLGGDPVAENLIRTLVVLAERLDLSLVAEGVETDEQRDILRRLGCDVAQGYLFARPAPAEQIEGLFPAPQG
ncbi:putative bifunctional diguanylate cyclase/phosphodiesterase [Thioalkalivibrio sulfidiphilus]|uniref:putative bifunctional diguanylate cyclase/phosphodiesterase n=1 Tax=Thioalkalivibrio sulfidiphilus TaxID=1033854 RepID=UPI0002DB09C0|nr:GGDEF domain-containing protein [Thioalkalivibrio sulfidiphilus]